jgi:hypothetical protein
MRATLFITLPSLRPKARLDFLEPEAGELTKPDRGVLQVDFQEREGILDLVGNQKRHPRGQALVPAGFQILQKVRAGLDKPLVHNRTY